MNHFYTLATIIAMLDDVDTGEFAKNSVLNAASFRMIGTIKATLQRLHAAETDFAEWGETWNPDRVQGNEEYRHLTEKSLLQYVEATQWLVSQIEREESIPDHEKVLAFYTQSESNVNFESPAIAQQVKERMEFLEISEAKAKAQVMAEAESRQADMEAIKDTFHGFIKDALTPQDPEMIASYEPATPHITRALAYALAYGVWGTGPDSVNNTVLKRKLDQYTRGPKRYKDSNGADFFMLKNVAQKATELAQTVSQEIENEANDEPTVG